MPNRTNDLNAWDRDHVFHPSTHMALHARGESPRRMMQGGEGCYITDSEGRARTTFHAPDSLTRYRVMAVAVKVLDAVATQFSATIASAASERRKGVVSRSYP